MWTAIVGFLGIVGIVCAWGTLHWYLTTAPTDRVGKVLTYVLGAVGLLAFAWALTTIVHTVE